MQLKGDIDGIQERGILGHHSWGEGMCGEIVAEKEEAFTVCAIKGLMATTERLGKMTGDCPSLCPPVHSHYSQLCFCDST